MARTADTSHDSTTQVADDEARWAAVVERDAGHDGAFVFAVRTTGIYCRPSCGARRPKRENAAFYTTPDEAEADGFRACKRCQPRGAAKSETDTELIAAACRVYTARLEAGEQFMPIPKNSISATDVMVTASGLLKAADLAVFELGMWQSWTGR